MKSALELVDEEGEGKKEASAQAEAEAQAHEDEIICWLEEDMLNKLAKKSHGNTKTRRIKTTQISHR